MSERTGKRQKVVRNQPPEPKPQVTYDADDCDFKPNEPSKDYLMRMFQTIIRHQEILFKTMQTQNEDRRMSSKQAATDPKALLSPTIFPTTTTSSSTNIAAATTCTAAVHVPHFIQVSANSQFEYIKTRFIKDAFGVLFSILVEKGLDSLVKISSSNSCLLCLQWYTPTTIRGFYQGVAASVQEVHSVAGTKRSAGSQDGKVSDEQD